MRVLLDTHTVIWALEGSEKLSSKARNLIETPSNEILVSAVSAWEIAIKRALGRLTTPDDLEGAIEGVGFVALPLSFSAPALTETLGAHHQDPFDRMLVAQAIEEKVPIVTADKRIGRYAVRTIW